MMTDEEYTKFHDEKYAELPSEFREAATKMLTAELDSETQELIRKAHKAFGAMWVHNIPSGHFGFGMAVRNLLRTRGFTDADAGGNLDDYYCQLIEAAVGVRPL